MKFLCGNCKAKYQIADEKATGRTLRMKCRRCGHDILIDGHVMATPSSPPPGTGKRPGGSSVAVLPTPSRGGSGVGPLPGPQGALRPPVPPPAPSGLSADFRRHVAAPPAVPARVSAPYDLWHVAIQDVPVGPMTRDELHRKVGAGAVTEQSLCWREGMDDWRPLGELPELASVLRRSLPPAALHSQRPQGRRAPPPPAARPPAIRPEDDFDDEGSEPTRIADMTGSLPPVTASGATSQSRVSAVGFGAAASSPMAPPAPASAPAALSEPPPPRRKSSMNAATGAALGASITLAALGVPMLIGKLYAPAPDTSAPTAAVATATPSAPKIELEVPEPEPVETEEPVAAAETAKGTRSNGAKAPVGGKAPTGGKAPGPKAANDGLSAEERALLERMGGGPDIAPINSGRSAAGGGSRPTGSPLNPGQLMNVVKQNQPALKRCYETALRSAGGQHDETIKITVTVTVGMSGTVSDVDTQGTGIGNMTTCLRSAVKRWRFPSAGDESVFSFPVVFQPGA